MVNVVVVAEGGGQYIRDGGVGSTENKEKENSKTGDATLPPTTTYKVIDTAMFTGMSEGLLVNSSRNILGLYALVSLTAGGIDKYAVSSNVYQRFVDGLHQRKTGENEGVAVALVVVVGYTVVMSNDLMYTRK